MYYRYKLVPKIHDIRNVDPASISLVVQFRMTSYPQGLEDLRTHQPQETRHGKDPYQNDATKVRSIDGRVTQNGQYRTSHQPSL
jgi:hypothetical protein